MTDDELVKAGLPTKAYLAELFGDSAYANVDEAIEKAIDHVLAERHQRHQAAEWRRLLRRATSTN